MIAKERQSTVPPVLSTEPPPEVHMFALWVGDPVGGALVLVPLVLVVLPQAAASAAQETRVPNRTTDERFMTSPRFVERRHVQTPCPGAHRRPSGFRSRLGRLEAGRTSPAFGGSR